MDAKTKPATPPRELPAEGVALWRSIARQWADDGLVPDARERRVLEDACREAAMLAALEEALDQARTDGQLIVKGSMGQPVVNSLVAECRRSRAQVMALLGKLDFSEPSPEVELTTGSGMTASQAGRLGGFAKHYGRKEGSA